MAPFRVNLAYLPESRFPLECVFRIYDNCLASGIEVIFGYSLILLKKNEEKLLKMKFDEMLSFLNTRLFDAYKVNVCRLNFNYC